MTVNEALAASSAIIGESADRERMLGWLYEIEDTVCREIGMTHSVPAPDMTPITSETDGNRVLFVPDPDSQLYVLYIIMKNDLYLRDTQQYVNSAAVFAGAYSAFADRYNRENMPTSQSGISL